VIIIFIIYFIITIIIIIIIPVDATSSKKPTAPVLRRFKSDQDEIWQDCSSGRPK